MKLNSKQTYALKTILDSEQEAHLAFNLSKSNLLEALDKLAFPIFEKSKELKTDLKSLENSKEFGSNEVGIYRWIRSLIDFKELKNLGLLESFERYVGQNGINVDVENDCLYTYEGPNLILNEDGDIFDEDSQKWILSKKDYDSKEDLKQKIEAWRTKNSYFPAVFRQDRYGNVFLINGL